MAEARAARLPAWAWPLLALPIVAGVGAWTYWAVSSAVQVRLQGSLKTMLASSASALGQWLDAQANLAAVMAADPRVRTDVEAQRGPKLAVDVASRMGSSGSVSELSLEDEGTKTGIRRVP
jgi:hypothetical protein